MNTKDELLNFEDKKFNNVKKVSRSKAIKLTADSFKNFTSNVKDKLSIESKIQKEMDSYNNTFKEIKNMAHIEPKSIDNSELIDKIETEIAILEKSGIKLIELNEKIKRVSFYKDALAKPIKLKDKFIYTLRNKKELYKIYKLSIQNKSNNVSEYSEYVGNIQNDLFKSIKNKNDIKLEDNLNKLYGGMDKYVNQEPYSLDNNINDAINVDTKTNEPNIQNVNNVVENVSGVVNKVEPQIGDFTSNIDSDKDVYSYSSGEINRLNNIDKILKGSTSKKYTISNANTGLKPADNNIDTSFTDNNIGNVKSEVTNEISNSDLNETVKLNEEILAKKPDVSNSDNNKSNEISIDSSFDFNKDNNELNKYEQYLKLDNALKNVLTKVSENNSTTMVPESNSSTNDDIQNTFMVENNESETKKSINDGVDKLIELDQNVISKENELYKEIKSAENKSRDNKEISFNTFSLDELISLRADLNKQLEMVNKEIKEKNDGQLEIEVNKYVVDNFHVGEDADTIGHYKENNDFSEYFSNPDVMESVRTEKIRQNPDLAEDYRALKELLTEGYNPEDVSSLAVNSKEEVDFSEEIDRLVNLGIKK